ncbi:hypothetical protein DRI50_11935 [candidate division KSB1 bacterium]|nr:MAG: hypothetical protein DRI50_11935 [candidate division KSB1 bacterium]
MSGQVVQTLLSTTLEAGLYLAPWDSRDDREQALNSGVYYSRLKSGKFSAVNRMVLLR